MIMYLKICPFVSEELGQFSRASWNWWNVNSQVNSYCCRRSCLTRGTPQFQRTRRLQSCSESTDKASSHWKIYYGMKNVGFSSCSKPMTATGGLQTRFSSCPPLCRAGITTAAQLSGNTDIFSFYVVRDLHCAILCYLILGFFCDSEQKFSFKKWCILCPIHQNAFWVQQD